MESWTALFLTVFLIYVACTLSVFYDIFVYFFE